MTLPKEKDIVAPRQREKCNVAARHNNNIMSRQHGATMGFLRCGGMTIGQRLRQPSSAPMWPSSRHGSATIRNRRAVVPRQPIVTLPSRDAVLFLHFYQIEYYFRKKD